MGIFGLIPPIFSCCSLCILGYAETFDLLVGLSCWILYLEAYVDLGHICQSDSLLVLYENHVLKLLVFVWLIILIIVLRWRMLCLIYLFFLVIKVVFSSAVVILLFNGVFG